MHVARHQRGNAFRLQAWGRDGNGREVKIQFVRGEFDGVQLFAQGREMFIGGAVDAGQLVRPHLRFEDGLRLLLPLLARGAGTIRQRRVEIGCYRGVYDLAQQFWPKGRERIDLGLLDAVALTPAIGAGLGLLQRC
ncbi:MAG: hypothetical protein AB7I34_15215 [Rhizobiaceae bacterium]